MGSHRRGGPDGEGGVEGRALRGEAGAVEEEEVDVEDAVSIELPSGGVRWRSRIVDLALCFEVRSNVDGGGGSWAWLIWCKHGRAWYE